MKFDHMFNWYVLIFHHIYFTSSNHTPTKNIEIVSLNTSLYKSSCMWNLKLKSQYFSSFTRPRVIYLLFFFLPWPTFSNDIISQISYSSRPLQIKFSKFYIFQFHLGSSWIVIFLKIFYALRNLSHHILPNFF